jgi:BirA family biotin operon repressor/biotin-[acetyl-CoA-carboxylase] ligase
LSACIAVATRQFFDGYDRGSIKIKWPNDIYWQDRKLGGILIENIVRSKPDGGNWDWAVVGIGVNINQTNFGSELKNPTSLKQITGKSFDQIELAKKLCVSFDDFYRNLIKEETKEILKMYNRFLYKKGESVKLKKDNRVFSATIRNVTPTGQLVVQHGIEEQFDFGEIEWLI